MIATLAIKCIVKQLKSALTPKINSLIQTLKVKTGPPTHKSVFALTI